MDRSDLQIFNSEPVVVELGGRTFIIAPQLKRYSGRFCGKVRAFFDSYPDAWAAALSLFDNTAQPEVDMKSAIPQFLELAGGAALDLIYDYNAELEEARGFIEENATVTECVETLKVCIGLAFGPFASLVLNPSSMTRTTTEPTTSESTTSDTSTP